MARLVSPGWCVLLVTIQMPHSVSTRTSDPSPDTVATVPVPQKFTQDHVGQMKVATGSPGCSAEGKAGVGPLALIVTLAVVAGGACSM